MRFAFRLTIAAGCVGFLALSFPAFGRPVPRDGAHAQHARAVMVLLPKPRPRRLHARVSYHVPLYIRHLVQASKPLLGWPALVTEARKYLGTNPTDRNRLWCATFMNLILAKLGYAGTNSDAARSFAYYGKRISKPKVGAIAVLTRGKRGGHVGVVSGFDAHGNPIIISGNHNKRVGEGVYPRSRVIAYVLPTRRHLRARRAFNRRVRYASARAKTPVRPLDSPITELIATLRAERPRADIRVPRRRALRYRRQARAPSRLVRQMSD